MLSDLRSTVMALRAQHRPSLATGFVETALPSVHLFWADQPVARAPLSYAPGIAVIVSGRKTGCVEDRRVEYGPGQYLAVGLPLYFECETQASRAAPMMGVFLSSDLQDLQQLAEGITAHETPDLPPQSGLGIEPLEMADPMLEAVTRLVQQLQDPAEAALLGPNTLREAFFHALKDPHGRVLLSQTRTNRPEARIAALLRTLEDAPERLSSIEDLAQAAGMSPASLHRHFKAVTGLSPLQYQKRKRLMRAKNLLVFDRLGVAEVAKAVGYASAAQFSRDFSAYFGTPPSRADRYPYPV